jgi:hypothetical protein
MFLSVLATLLHGVCCASRVWSQAIQRRISCELLWVHNLWRAGSPTLAGATRLVAPCCCHLRVVVASAPQAPPSPSALVPNRATARPPTKCPYTDPHGRTRIPPFRAWPWLPPHACYGNSVVYISPADVSCVFGAGGSSLIRPSRCTLLTSCSPLHAPRYFWCSSRALNDALKLWCCRMRSSTLGGALSGVSHKVRVCPDCCVARSSPPDAGRPRFI